MLGKHVIIPFSSINYIFSMDCISLLNFTYVFAIITCLGFLVCVREGDALGSVVFRKFGYFMPWVE